jgi:hypothetical protein
MKYAGFARTFVWNSVDRYAHASPHYGAQGMQQPQYGMQLPAQHGGFPQLAGFGFAQ